MMLAQRTFSVPDQRCEGCGHLELNIKDEVVGWLGAYPESLIKIGHDLVQKAKDGDLEDIEGS